MVPGYFVPDYPTATSTRRQAIYPTPFHHITTVEYVNYVGCKWSFYPGVGPILFLISNNIFAREFRGRFIKTRLMMQGGNRWRF
jgi:hypothetical protein